MGCNSTLGTFLKSRKLNCQDCIYLQAVVYPAPYVTFYVLNFNFAIPQMAPKKKPLPLATSLKRIEEERVNVQIRTQRRIAMLFAETDKTVDKATQTEIPMREVLVEVIEWHGCLNLFCFALLLLCVNLLYFQWLYLNKVDKV